MFSRVVQLKRVLQSYASYRHECIALLTCFVGQVPSPMVLGSCEGGARGTRIAFGVPLRSPDWRSAHRRRVVSGYPRSQRHRRSRDHRRGLAQSLRDAAGAVSQPDRQLCLGRHRQQHHASGSRRDGAQPDEWFLCPLCGRGEPQGRIVLGGRHLPQRSRAPGRGGEGAVARRRLHEPGFRVGELP